MTAQCYSIFFGELFNVPAFRSGWSFSHCWTTVRLRKRTVLRPPSETLARGPMWVLPLFRTFGRQLPTRLMIPIWPIWIDIYYRSFEIRLILWKLLDSNSVPPMILQWKLKRTTDLLALQLWLPKLCFVTRCSSSVLSEPSLPFRSPITMVIPPLGKVPGLHFVAQRIVCCCVKFDFPASLPDYCSTVSQEGEECSQSSTI